tara:strand:+ start:46 stop:567 length:522 start_codon:yes stop_codon:yes gene_type:complete
MFIYKDKINPKICLDLINIFKNSNQKESIKNEYTTMNQITVDIYNPLLESYIKSLNKVKDKYIKKYKYVDKEQEPWNLSPQIKIQKYKPKQYYSGWHSELDGIERKQKRILVFTTYLNTIQKGGETEFYYQKQKIKPVAGRTIIFPPYWTHTHKGNITNTTKYIITGWYTYVH